jgi:hypothetical protein
MSRFILTPQLSKLIRHPLYQIYFELRNFGLEEVAKRSPSKGRKPEEFVNLRFLQELEREGFFKGLIA